MLNIKKSTLGHNIVPAMNFCSHFFFFVVFLTGMLICYEWYLAVNKLTLKDKKFIQINQITHQNAQCFPVDITFSHYSNK